VPSHTYREGQYNEPAAGRRKRRNAGQLTNDKLKGLRRECQMKKISEGATGCGDERTLPASLVCGVRSQRSFPHITTSTEACG
jgi:hypothetical protein